MLHHPVNSHVIGSVTYQIRLQLMRRGIQEMQIVQYSTRNRPQQQQLSGMMLCTSNAMVAQLLTPVCTQPDSCRHVMMQLIYVFWLGVTWCLLTAPETATRSKCMPADKP